MAGDIIVLSSKVVSMSEGSLIDLSHIEVSEEAMAWDARLHRKQCDPAFRQAVLDEAERMHGRVLGHCPNAMLTELKPGGLTEGTIIVCNAGLDQSNVGEHFAIGWPRDPVTSVKRLRRSLERHICATIPMKLSYMPVQPWNHGTMEPWNNEHQKL